MEDIQIIKLIVQSRSEVMKEVDDPEKFRISLAENNFSLTDPTILAALTKSFTNHISYKVSTEAYQRHSVRMHLIEVLRDCLRPSKELEFSRTFTQGERLLQFTSRILRIYLKNEIQFQDDGNIDILVNLARALMSLSPRDKTFVPHLEKLLLRISELKQTEDSQRLVLSAVKEKDPLGFSFETVERLYVSQSAKLIEEPLIESFIVNLRDSKDNPCLFKNSTGIDNLLKVAVESPIIYQIASSVLKEILVHSDYSPKVIDYIKFFLKSLNSYCQERNKNVLDLYPLNLQSCVLLLNIEPDQHTSNSRNYVLKSLENINETNSEETLILMSHFPNWLQTLAAHIEDSRLIVTNMSVDDEL